MKDLDFYEFTAIIVPGGVLLLGLIWASRLPPASYDLSIGGFAAGLILAYALGHLVQQVGTLLEGLWWRLWGGMPTDWPRSGRARLLSAGHVQLLQEQLRVVLRQPELHLGPHLSRGTWATIVRQIYAFVDSHGRAARLNVFNGNYGLCRGLAAALAGLAFGLPALGRGDLAVTAVFVAGAGIALWRMHRFGCHYALELFLQFLTLNCTRDQGLHEEDPRRGDGSLS